MLESYLFEMRQELSRGMPAHDVVVRLAEIEAHLKEGINARLDLGLEAKEAEREAILVFGASRPLARDLVKAAQVPLAPRLYLVGAGYGLVGVFIMVAYALYERFPNAALYFLWVLGALTVCFAVASFKARRPAPIPIFATGVAGTLATWILLGSTWLDLYAYGGTGVVPPHDGDRQMAEYQRLLSQRTSDMAVLTSAMAALQSPVGIEAFCSGRGYTGPTRSMNARYDTPLELIVYDDSKSAESAWLDLKQNSSWRFDTDSLRRSISAYREARSDSTYMSILHAAPSIVPGGVGGAAAVTLVDAAFSGLGALVFALGRRRSGSGGLHV